MVELMKSDMPPSLRKAAILIAALDEAGAERLLAQMGRSRAARVRAAVMQLGSVDPAEQREILEEFLRSSATPATDPGIELDGALAARLAQARTHSYALEPPQETEDRPPFRFLHEAAGDTLCRFLRHEHPQTIAVVLSHLPPTRAADVVTRLERHLQVDVLRRIAELDEMDPEVLRDVERELESLLRDELRSVHRRSAGVAAVGAILRSIDRHERAQVMTNLQQHAEPLAQRLAQPTRADRVTRSSQEAPPGPPQRATLSEPSDMRRSAAKRPPVRPSGILEKTVAKELTIPEKPSPTTHQAPPATAPPPVVPFDAIAKLDTRSLAALVQAADPQTVLLALTGAPSALVDRIAEQLPPRQSRQLRRQIEQVGPLRLRDVEQAQLQLSQLAGLLITRQLIQMPNLRGFTADV